MMLFTVVNLEDEDMRFYAWMIISSTISIFVAVLMFSSVDSVVHEIVLKGYPVWVQCLGDFAQMMGYYMMLQLSVAFTSGALLEKPFVRGLLNAKGEKISIEQQKGDRERIMKACATLLSHTTGFAAINFGGAMQHGEFFHEHPLCTFLVVPGQYILQLVLQSTVLFVRSKVVAAQLDRHKNRDTYQEMKASIEEDPDDEEAEEERNGKEYALEKWEDEVFESENEIAGLQVSFLTLQACRFNITGVLPNNLGIELEHYIHPTYCSIELGCLSLFFVFATIGLVLLLNQFKEDDKEMTLFKKLLKKMVIVTVNASSMAFAWCQLYIFKWEAAKRIPSFGSPNTLTADVLLALAISTVAFSLIFVLDKISDSGIAGNQADTVIFSIISALGILVGFSWEQSFDGGVETIAALTPSPILAELGLAVVVALIVIAPWQLYILQTVITLGEEREESKKGGEGEKKEEKA
eukprot:gnl/TRDRNA2_/TRDRNA2_177001_c3_seq8.p1 gnl/TRDRNA2_/TRDRNA2_177001_c3~~gnl/TRDRNA2_/TRDRNA2_177001_c3_seq8.p1  ORF type:complete len:491 (-),score=128.34 gnl/TRDRNA2_/TRDRNA2_177001_c3_seq8:108-1502(-)